MEFIAVQKLAIRAIAIGLALATFGCVFPYTTTRTSGEISSSQLQDLEGKTKSHVRSELGEPTHAFVQSDMGESYYVYSGLTSSTLHIRVMKLESEHTTTYDEDSDTLCYLLVFDTNRRVVRYEAQRGDDHFCPIYFWSESEVRAMLEAQALQGEREAAILLAGQFHDATYLKQLAEQGDRKAALTLAVDFSESGPIRVLVEDGDSAAAFTVYQQLSDERQTFAEAWRWLCMAANGRSGEAQARVGNWHRTATWQSGIEHLEWLRDEVNVHPDNRLAYMWYEMATSNGYISAQSSREFVETEMTPEEIAQAEQMVRDWNPGDCPSVGNRLGPPGET